MIRTRAFDQPFDNSEGVQFPQRSTAQKLRPALRHCTSIIRRSSSVICPRHISPSRPNPFLTDSIVGDSSQDAFTWMFKFWESPKGDDTALDKLIWKRKRTTYHYSSVWLERKRCGVVDEYTMNRSKLFPESTKQFKFNALPDIYS